MSMPKGIQRKRTKGWRMPENAVSVTRPGKYGNPFTVREYGDMALCMFESNLKIILASRPDFLLPLRGKDLACFCPLDTPCHRDILIRLANTPIVTEVKS